MLGDWRLDRYGRATAVSPKLLGELAVGVVGGWRNLRHALRPEVVEALTRPGPPPHELVAMKRNAVWSKSTQCSIQGCPNPREIGLVCRRCSDILLKTTHIPLSKLGGGTIPDLSARLKTEVLSRAVGIWKELATEVGIKSIDKARKFAAETHFSPSVIASYALAKRRCRFLPELTRVFAGPSAWVEAQGTERYVAALTASHLETMLNKIALFGMAVVGNTDTRLFGLPFIRHNLNPRVDLDTRVPAAGLLVCSFSETENAVYDATIARAFLELANLKQICATVRPAIWVSFAEPGSEHITINGTEIHTTPWFTDGGPQERASMELHVGLAMLISAAALTSVLEAGFGCVVFHSPPPMAAFAAGVTVASGLPQSTVIWSMLCRMASSDQYPEIQLDPAPPKWIHTGLSRVILGGRRQRCRAAKRDASKTIVDECQHCSPNFVDGACGASSKRRGPLTLTVGDVEPAECVRVHIGPWANVQGVTDKVARCKEAAALLEPALDAWEKLLFTSSSGHAAKSRSGLVKTCTVDTVKIDNVPEALLNGPSLL